MTKSAAPLRVIEETPAYWRVVFDYPPFNIVDATIFEGLQDLLARMDASPSLRVVMFESADPDGYIRPSHQIPGGQHREDPGLRSWCEQRVRPRLRHALRISREHATGPPGSRGGTASRRRRHGTPSTSGWPRPRARDRSRRE